MEEKNFIVFMVLTALLVMVWFMFFAPKPKPRPVPEKVLSGNPVSGTGNAAGNTASPAVAVGMPAAESSPSLVAAEEGERVIVWTDVYIIEFSSRNAAPVSWLLPRFPEQKCYPYQVDIRWPPFQRRPVCRNGGDAFCCSEYPVEMVDRGLSPSYLPFISQVTVDDFTVPLNTTWEIESGDVVVLGGTTADELSFRTRLPDGRILRKIYRFHQSRYDVDLEFRVSGTAPQAGAVDLAMFYRWDPVRRTNVPTWNYRGAETHDGRRLSQLKPEDVVKSGILEKAAVNWAGFTNEYFLTAVLASGSSAVNFAVKFLGPEEEKKNKRTMKNLVGWVRSAPTEDDLKQGVVSRLKIFVGPKEKKILFRVRPTLQDSIDYGTLEILVRPLLWCLVMLNKVVGNYGVTIVLLTIILRMGMFPLTYTSQKSMKRMQKLQPELQKIREKYPNDRLKQNEEMQALWRREKINPAMGCLPVLLQFPVFLAFYKALLISIELRQAPFFSWIVDLSARDPLYIWPVLMGATQIVTQKMTPTQMDPLQAKIFLMMPVVFTYILRDFPAGLLIYWTVSNLVGIAQQIYVNRRPD